MSHCLGRQSWETPIGAVAESSLEVLEAWPLDRKRMEKGEDLQTGIQIQLFDFAMVKPWRLKELSDHQPCHAMHRRGDNFGEELGQWWWCCAALGDRLARLDKAATLDRGCWGEAFHFVERAAERIIWRGLLFDEIETEVPILQDPGLSYEACPAAVLLAVLSCGARAAAARHHALLEQWNEAFAVWNSLPWTRSLVWYNLQDPLVRSGMYAAVSQNKALDVHVQCHQHSGASILAEQSGRQSSAVDTCTSGPLASGSETICLDHAASGSMAPFGIWERNLEPVFSESLKDPVLERIFGLIGVTSGYYVEVGTQSGEQCNTRYLRVRYGFSGLMVDDNFRNPNVNQKRRFVTPANVVEIFHENDVPKDFDMLSLDTDGFEWLLWLKLQKAGFSPRLVVLEYGENLPFMDDVLVRYTTLPIHRLCLSQLQQFPRISGGSIYSLLQLGMAWGYRLIHIVACGTSDLIFVRKDVLEASGVTFPAQDDAEGLCALATYQCQAKCVRQWPKAKPDKAAFTTAAKVLQGDFEFRQVWGHERQGSSIGKKYPDLKAFGMVEQRKRTKEIGSNSDLKDVEILGAGFAMGNHVACCGHGAVTEPEVGPGPPPKPQEEETVEISPKGVIEEAKAKDVEEMPPSPTSPTSQEKRQQFGSRVVSSCSLQGIHIDEDGGGVKIDGGRLRKEMGISYMKRLAASRAPWPSWEFKQEQDQFSFCNHTMLGDIREEFVADGTPYSTVDGHKQTLECAAIWEGSTLVIERCGPQGRFREERSIDEKGQLHFKLQGMEEKSIAWGRTFKRKGLLDDWA
ncbi:unnamed protein product [Cladocopium goreaui]|uniref:PPIase cyclophilin-type domain-containing protein n=1 Tax=Cladocopium goreaui TaxID=2562237 RepID=A0A9P1DH37_9DINO|nr:unnamed protein product [Cladocopium goreaui]